MLQVDGNHTPDSAAMMYFRIICHFIFLEETHNNVYIDIHRKQVIGVNRI